MTEQRLHHSNSRTAGWKDCARVEYLRRRRGWEPAAQNHHFGVGKCWHRAATEVWVEACEWTGRLHEPDQKRAFELAYEMFLLEWHRQGLPEGEDLENAEYLKGKRPDVAERLLRAYVERRWAMLRTIELLAVEYRFERPLLTLPDGRLLTYAMVLDKVFKYRGSPSVHAVDHKTTSQGGEKGLYQSYLKELQIDPQFVGYADALQTGWGSAASEILADVVVFKDVARGKETFQLVPVNPTADRLAAWLRNQEGWSRQIVEYNAKLDSGMHPDAAFPYNERSCVGKFGPCAYYDLCLYHPDITTLGTEPPLGFVVKERDPEEDQFFDALVPHPVFKPQVVEGR